MSRLSASPTCGPPTSGSAFPSQASLYSPSLVTSVTIQPTSSADAAPSSLLAPALSPLPSSSSASPKISVTRPATTSTRPRNPVLSPSSWLGYGCSMSPIICSRARAGPSLPDMSGDDHGRVRIANNCFSFFMAIGNVLGYAAGSLPKLYKVLPFTITIVCDETCANLKTLFLIDVVLLITIVGVATSIVKETPLSSKKDTGANESSSAIGDPSSIFKSLSKKMWLLYAVTAVNWIGWFPWLLYDTDWMGLEVYGGKPHGTALEKTMYDTGVRTGSLGLMLNAIVLAVASLLVEPMSKLVGGVKRWWCVVNFILGIGLVLTVPVTKGAEAYRAVHGLILPSSNIKGAALGVFSLLGIPLPVNFSVPFALASIYSNTLGGGQGLSLGLLNLAIVIVQIIVSLVNGVIDNSFRGGNLPAFIMGATASFVSTLMALIVIPDTPSSESIDIVPGGGH